MKKKTIALILGALMIIGLVGCDTPEPEVSDVNTDRTSQEVYEEKNTDANTPSQENYEEKYQETLDTIYNFIKNIDSDAEYDEQYMGIFEAALSLGDESLSKIGYIFKDLNGDDVPELLIGSFETMEYAFTNNDIYMLYALKNDKPELILEGRSRSMYSLTDDGKFCYMGSNGAAYSIFGTFYLSKDGEIVCDDYYFTYPDDNDYSKIELYHNQTGEFEREGSEKLDIALDAFWTLQDEAAQTTAKITAASFESWGD